jgi:hypothetical protein
MLVWKPVVVEDLQELVLFRKLPVAASNPGKTANMGYQVVDLMDGGLVKRMGLRRWSGRLNRGCAVMCFSESLVACIRDHAAI